MVYEVPVNNQRTGACPSCGTVASRNVYDIGSGPELSCAHCEWCWGADGQDLQPIQIPFANLLLPEADDL